MKPEQVHEYTTQQRRAGDTLYLLIDPLADCEPEHPLSLSSFEQTLGSEALMRIQRDDLAHLPQHLPTLVQLAVPGAALSEHLRLSALYAANELKASRRYICGWLLSEQPIDVVAAHIARQCDLLNYPGLLANAPWYEPARLDLMSVAMKNLGHVVWPVRTWLFPTESGGYSEVLGSPLNQPLEVTQQAREIQYIAPQILQFLGAWRDLNIAEHAYASSRREATSTLPAHAPVEVFNLIHQANQQGLLARSDVHCIGLHLLKVNPLLLQHPTIQNDVAQAAAGKQDLASRFATYENSTWAQITASLPKARSFS